jgi:hypothetical protein
MYILTPVTKGLPIVYGEWIKSTQACREVVIIC